MNNKFKNVFTFGGFIIGGIVVIVLFFFGGTLFSSNDVVFADELGNVNNFEEHSNKISGELNANLEENKMFVHVLGAVNNPGVVQVRKGARVYEIIDLAGGITSEADLEWINLAEELEDEERVIIPYKIFDKDGNAISIKSQIYDKIYNEKREEDSNISSKYLKGLGYELLDSSENESISNSNSLININSADAKTLETLDGIGSSTANKIIKYRQEVGKFNTIEELKNVKGIGDSKFNAIKNKITV